MLVNKHNLHRTLQRRPKSVQVRITIFREMVPPNDGPMSPRTIVHMSFDSESLPVRGDELAEDGYSNLERDDEGNWNTSGPSERASGFGGELAVAHCC